MGRQNYKERLETERRHGYHRLQTCLAIRYLSQDIWLRTVRVTCTVTKQTLPEQPVQKAFCSFCHSTNHDTLILFSSDNGQDAGQGQGSSIYSLWPEPRDGERRQRKYFTQLVWAICVNRLFTRESNPGGCGPWNFSLLAFWVQCHTWHRWQMEKIFN